LLFAHPEEAFAQRKNTGKTTTELAEEPYSPLKEKGLELHKQNQNASIVSIMRC